MAAAAAAALLGIAETSRAALRHEEPGAEASVEARYADILEALQWLLDRAELATARRLARSLVNFWMSTSRLPEGDAWSERLLRGPLTPGSDVALSLHEHGYLILWAGDYERSGRRLAEARVMAGDLEGAREVIERRIALAKVTGDNFVVWAETGNLSMVERQLGNPDRAEELSLQAVATDIVATRELFLAWTLNGLAAVTAARGRAERAAVLLGAADSLIERAGGGWPPDELEQHEQTRAALTRDLPSDRLERATARGQALRPDAVVNYALHDDETQEPE